MATTKPAGRVGKWKRQLSRDRARDAGAKQIEWLSIFEIQ
jgi:hypothetical protein